KPGGTFVTYNFFRQGWIVERIAAMMQETFGCPATVLSLPYQEKPSDSFLDGDFTMIIGGCNPNIAQTFAAKKNFWLDPLPPRNMTIDGFAERPEMLELDRAEQLQRIAPTGVPERADAPCTTH